MSWDDLRFVLAVSRHGTLTGAADALDVTHTTVGRRIRALEAHLGARLFDRTPAGLVATESGQELVAAAEQMEAEALAAENRLLGRDGELRGPLRVSTLDFLLWRVAAGFASFIVRYPEVELTVTTSVDPVSLSRREADVALRLTNTPPEPLIGRKVLDVGFAAYASDALVACVGEGAPYAAFPWIGLDERAGGGWVDSWLAEHAPGARVAVRIDESGILRRQAVCAGMGVFFMPCFEGDAIPGLRRLGPVHFTRQVWLLTLPELRRTRRVRAFVDHMAEALRS